MIKINRLDNDTINKIAAGEVIERPMSVVKELVENSIDANSDEIVIEIKNGGKDYIRISDNGHGMNYNQIDDAFKRHYTSKISSAEDLHTIQTLGFRGEALASISQVSRVEVYTKTKDEITGVRMIYEGGSIISKEEYGCQNGTTFIIRDLFYNVPARLKFLKSSSAEASAINTAVTSLALVKENISFKYINNGKIIFKTPKTNDMINVLSCLYDNDLVSSMIPVSYEYGGMKVNGYTSNLSYYRGNKKNQLLFINDRLVKHVRAHYFIESAYSTYLPINKHPACFLNLTIDPSILDVNVHPAKTEVRIFDEDKVLGILKVGVSHALSKKNLVKQVNADTLTSNKRHDTSKENFKEKLDNLNNIEIIEVENVCEEKSSTDYSVDKNINDISVDKMLFGETIHNSNIPTIINDTVNSNEINENIRIDDIFEMDTEKATTYVDSVNSSKENTVNLSIHDEIANLKPIGVLFKTYILCEDINFSEFYMIDQHAAHERVNYENYMNQYLNRHIIQQEMLIPELIELSFDDNNIYSENANVFKNLGFNIEPFGNNSYKISSIPLILCDKNVKMIFLEILDSIKSLDAKTFKDEEIRKVIKKSCVNAVKAHDDLKDIEIRALLNSLSKCEKPYTCPHGRPIIIKLSKYEIERMFERIQI